MRGERPPLLSAARMVTLGAMKAVTIREAQGQLGELIAEACRGEFIVLTDGDKQVALEPRVALDLEEDSPAYSLGPTYPRVIPRIISALCQGWRIK